MMSRDMKLIIRVEREGEMMWRMDDDDEEHEMSWMRRRLRPLSRVPEEKFLFLDHSAINLTRGLMRIEMMREEKSESDEDGAPHLFLQHILFLESKRMGCREGERGG